MLLTHLLVEDSGSIPDISTNSRVYKMMKRRKDLSCGYCRPNRGENGSYKKFRVKKQWQLDPRRRRDISIKTGFPHILQKNKKSFCF
jgi:hypothetical protein